MSGSQSEVWVLQTGTVPFVGFVHVPLNGRVRALCVLIVSRGVLSDEMQKACSIYGQWLVDASKVTEDEKVPYNTHLHSCLVGYFLRHILVARSFLRVLDIADVFLIQAWLLSWPKVCSVPRLRNQVMDEEGDLVPCMIFCWSAMWKSSGDKNCALLC